MDSVKQLTLRRATWLSRTPTAADQTLCRVDCSTQPKKGPKLAAKPQSLYAGYNTPIKGILCIFSLLSPQTEGAFRTIQTHKFLSESANADMNMGNNRRIFLP